MVKDCWQGLKIVFACMLLTCHRDMKTGYLVLCHLLLRDTEEISWLDHTIKYVL
jgi:hypothetical protein